MKNMFISLLVVGIMCCSIKTSEASVKSEISDKQYAPINTIAEFYNGSINVTNQNARIDFNEISIFMEKNNGFAKVNGKYVPYKTKEQNGYIIPVLNKNIIKEDEIYVPVQFLEKYCGLAFLYEDDKLSLNTNNGGKYIDTISIPSKIGSISTPIVESSRPINNN